MKFTIVFLAIFMLSVCAPVYGKTENKKAEPADVTLNVKVPSLEGSVQTLGNCFDQICSFEQAEGKIRILLKEAAKLGLTEKQKTYLEDVGQHVLSEPEKINYKDWEEISLAPLNLGFGICEKPDFFAWCGTEKIPDSIAEFTENPEEFLGVLPKSRKTAGFNPGELPEVKLVDLVCASNSSAVLTRLFPFCRDRFQILVFRNVVNEYFAEVVSRDVKKDLVSRWAAQADQETFLWLICMHGYCYFMGPVIVQDEKGNAAVIGSELKERLALMEEVKAWTLAVMGGLGDPKNKKPGKRIQSGRLMATYLALLLNRIRNTSEKAALPFKVQLGYLSENGAVGYDINKKKLIVTPARFRDAVRRLLFQCLRVIREDDTRGAETISHYDTLINRNLEALINKTPCSRTVLKFVPRKKDI